MNGIFRLGSALGPIAVGFATRLPGALLRRVPVLIALMLAASSGAWAGACSSAPLSAYLASGFSCTETIGTHTLTFSGFRLLAGTATGVDVTVLGNGFDFGSFSVGAGHVEDFTLAYTVAGDLVSLTLDLGAPVITGLGAIVDVEGTASGRTFLGSLEVYDNKKKGALDSSTLVLPELGGPFVIADNFVLSGRGGPDSTASVGELSNEFNTTVIPEPATMLLFGTGLFVAGAVLRHRRQA